MSQVQDFAMHVLHGDSDHQKWLLDEAEKFVDGKVTVEASLDVIRDLQRDAERYRFMRDEDNWGDDSGEDTWEILAESTQVAFDEIVDKRLAKSGLELA